jgi:hypothetical protein
VIVPPVPGIGDRDPRSTRGGAPRTRIVERATVVATATAAAVAAATVIVAAAVVATAIAAAIAPAAEPEVREVPAAVPVALAVPAVVLAVPVAVLAVLACVRVAIVGVGPRGVPAASVRSRDSPPRPMTGARIATRGRTVVPRRPPRPLRPGGTKTR